MYSNRKVNSLKWLGLWWIILCGMWGLEANASVVFGQIPPDPSEVAPPLTLTEASLFDQII